MPAYDPVAKLKAKEFSRKLSTPVVPVTGDPLDVTPTGDTETDDRAEVKAVKEMFAKADAVMKELGADEFHCTLVFASAAQRNAFLAKVAWPTVEGGRYVDGFTVAEMCGVELPPARLPSMRPGKTEKRIAETGEIGGYPE